jgi:alkylated DNA repair protein alkB family protein 8
MKRSINDVLNSSKTKPAIVDLTRTDFTETKTNLTVDTIPGLTYLDDFITNEEETRLVNYIDSMPWSTKISRRTQHYGFEYDYNSKTVSKETETPPIPKVFAEIIDRLLSQSLITERPNHALVNGIV